jgi:hypothetical protein
LSIQQILPLVNDKKAKALIATKISDALQAAKFCRDWRNRRIAHRDLDLALKEAAEPLAPASRANVKNALERLSDVVNEVSRHYRDAETHFEGTYDRGAHGLLYLLDTALEIQEERLARLKQGEYRPEEWRRKEL